jgi:NitT/TauT family transport system ATP-binding protein
MLLLDEPFGALDAFTREELWCILRDLHAAQKFNVILVTHDLRESVFLADTVYCMSRSPGRFVVKREIDLPRPRDLEVTYTPSSLTSCTNCGPYRSGQESRRPWCRSEGVAVMVHS